MDSSLLLVLCWGDGGVSHQGKADHNREEEGKVANDFKIEGATYGIAYCVVELGYHHERYDS